MRKSPWFFSQAGSVVLYVAAFGYDSRGALNIIAGLIVACVVLVVLALIGVLMGAPVPPRSVPAWMSTTTVLAHAAVLLWFGCPWLAAMYASSWVASESILMQRSKETSHAH